MSNLLKLSPRSPLCLRPHPQTFQGSPLSHGFIAQPAAPARDLGVVLDMPLSSTFPIAPSSPSLVNSTS